MSLLSPLNSNDQSITLPTVLYAGILFSGPCRDPNTRRKKEKRESILNYIIGMEQDFLNIFEVRTHSHGRIG